MTVNVLSASFLSELHSDGLQIVCIEFAFITPLVTYLPSTSRGDATGLVSDFRSGGHGVDSLLGRSCIN